MFSAPDMAKRACMIYINICMLFSYRAFSCKSSNFKLCELVLTIGATSAADERSFSALKRLKKYLRNSQSQDRLSWLALMNIGKSFLYSPNPAL
jgi:hypothetical protein